MKYLIIGILLLFLVGCERNPSGKMPANMTVWTVEMQEAHGAIDFERKVMRKMEEIEAEKEARKRIGEKG